MTEIILQIEKSDISDFNSLLKKEKIQIRNKLKLHLNESDLVYYLSVGGFVGLAKCLLAFFKIKHGTRKISIKTSHGDEINIEGNSIEEVEKMLESAKEIVFTVHDNGDKS